MLIGHSTAEIKIMLVQIECAIISHRSAGDFNTFVSDQSNLEVLRRVYRCAEDSNIKLQ